MERFQEWLITWNRDYAKELNSDEQFQSVTSGLHNLYVIKRCFYEFMAFVESENQLDHKTFFDCLKFAAELEHNIFNDEMRSR